MAKSLAEEVLRVAQKARVSLRTAAGEVLQDVMLDVVEHTPVDTGNLRANWMAALNAPSAGERSRNPVPSGGTKFPPADPATIAQIGVTMNGFDVGDTVYFTNNAEYVRVIEFGGQNRQPRAMVRNAIANAPETARQTLRRIKAIKGI